MSTIVVTPQPGLKVTQVRVFRSEWIKLRSLRSTVVTLAAAGLVVVGLAVLFAAFHSGQITGPGGGRGGPPTATDPTGISLSGITLAQLIVGSLGVLITAGEYSTGMIRSSLAAVPRRLPVLWAKAAVFAGVTLVSMTVATMLAFLGGQAVLAAGGSATAALGDPGVLRAVLGAAVQLTGVGVLGLALGVLYRAIAGPIATLFAVMLLLPALVGLLPDSVGTDVSPYLPSNAIGSFVSVTTATGALSPWTGLAVFIGYVLALLAAAAVLFAKRDA